MLPTPGWCWGVAGRRAMIGSERTASVRNETHRRHLHLSPPPLPASPPSQARILYVDPATKTVGLSLLPHLQALQLPSLSRSLVFKSAIDLSHPLPPQPHQPGPFSHPPPRHASCTLIQPPRLWACRSCPTCKHFSSPAPPPCWVSCLRARRSGACTQAWAFFWSCLYQVLTTRRT